MLWSAGTDRIRLGLSACLLGRKVRYDGGHKLDRFIVQTLGRYVELVPVGLGVPREAMRLTGDPQAPRLVTILTGLDHTDRLLTWARHRAAALAREALWGFIFKSNSPSCGLEGVKVYPGRGRPVKKGIGLFARVFRKHFPLLPVVDDSRLHDPELRENFI
ncbi:MAG: DUF523 domain-containing protein, partial [Deltaproteobacteria bacterium]|nr:DUF523 domain-containing protein [Deltaproteobacteria bacterium]